MSALHAGAGVSFITSVSFITNRRVYMLIQKTFVSCDLKAKGARNIREFQRKTAHGSRPAQNVINYVSTAPARADRGSDPLEKHTKAKNIRHSSQNTASMPILC